MYKIVLYDTSNFEDFPIGGQLTSIKNFLKYISNYQKEICKEILLIGITNKINEVGVIKKITIDDNSFDFLPVIYRNKDLNNVKSSLRIEYVKGLFKYFKKIKINKKTINYIHTPEAIIPLKLIYPFSQYIIFSHGSYFNMIKGFRFYQDKKIIMCFFKKFIIYAIKHASLIFTLDSDSTKKYMPYNKNIIQVDNSIILDETIKPKKNVHDPIRLLFVGRLSKVKSIDEIITATIKMRNVTLKIVGDGEEKQHLKGISKNYKNIIFEGSVKPELIKNYMQESDILIMNSIFEGKPMTIIEALSNALPIITTNVGGISYLVNEHIDAEFTDGKEKSIISAINTIKSNYANYSESALNNSKKFDYRTVNKKIMSEILKNNNKNRR